MFEQASRQKFRYSTPQGMISTEDLWDLPLTSTVGKANLDDIAKALHKELKSFTDEVSFVKPAVKSNELLQLKFDVVKHIIDIRVAERDAAAVTKAKNEKKQLIMGIIAQKENEKLSSASLEDLQKMLDEV